jgi:maternal-effect protein exuperantia
MEFLEWLEKINGEKDGVILVFHEQPKLAPYMMIEKMKKFNLFDRFTKIVKAFVNGFDFNNFAEKGKGLKYLSLSANFKVHSDQLGMDVKEPEDFEGNAAVRAKLSYDICKLMSYEGEKKDRVRRQASSGNDEQIHIRKSKPNRTRA